MNHDATTPDTRPEDTPSGGECLTVRELLVAFVDHETSSSEADRVEAHLATCASCRRELELERSLDTLLDAWALRPARAASGADDAPLRTGREVRSGVIRLETRRRRRRRWLASAAALLVAGTIGLATWWASHSPPAEDLLIIQNLEVLESIEEEAEEVSPELVLLLLEELTEEEDPPLDPALFDFLLEEEISGGNL